MLNDVVQRGVVHAEPARHSQGEFGMRAVEIAKRIWSRGKRSTAVRGVMRGKGTRLIANSRRSSVTYYVRALGHWAQEFAAARRGAHRVEEGSASTRPIS